MINKQLLKWLFILLGYVYSCTFTENWLKKPQDPNTTNIAAKKRVRLLYTKIRN